MLKVNKGLSAPETGQRLREEMCKHDPIQCIIPPYITEHLTQSNDPQIRRRAIAHLSTAATMRAFREAAQATSTLLAPASPHRRKYRLIYDAQQTDQLSASLARSEGDAATLDPAVTEAYEFSGNTYDFYDQLFQRNSLNDSGMTLVSTVHIAEADGTGKYVPMNNAFWNGQQMGYGDGDGRIFQRFTGSLDVVAHELTHGVQSFTSNLRYRGQSGALNEHFSDVFGVLVRQWRNREDSKSASWVVGTDILVPASTRRGIRDMENPGTAYVDDPDLGTDPQPNHISNIYTGSGDRGGVHINSGIPNRAFVLTARSLGGNAWDVAGRIWYDTMVQLNTNSQFLDCAKLTVQIAATHGTQTQTVVKDAWKNVGITV